MTRLSSLILSFCIGSTIAVNILDPTPLADTIPPYLVLDHPQAPTDLWQDKSAPLPTNSWWENLVLNTGEQVVMAMPFEIKALDDGLQVSLPGKLTEANYVLSTFTNDFSFSTSEGLVSRTISEPDLLSVRIAWGSTMSVPVVRGSPYITVQYNGATPVLDTIHAILSVNGAPPSGEITGNRFAVELNNGQTWIFYTTSDITFSVRGNSLTALSAFSGTLRAGVAFGGVNEADLDAYKDRIVTGCTVAANSNGDEATIEFQWETEGSGELLMLALPHHVDTLLNPVTINVVYNTLKGDITGVVGDVWIMTEQLTTISWNAPRAIDPTRVEDIRNALAGDIAFEVTSGDPYFAGKEMATLARLALIAEAIGEDALAQQYLDKVRPTLESWLDGTNPDALVYDQTWGGLVSTDGLLDSNADFGQGYYNDHHFHYGYHIYTAAVLAKSDPAWGARYNDKVINMIRDIAEPSGQDAFYPQTRNKDWYAGHSWANGIVTDFADSKNQESTSESVNGWYAVYLYGLATNNDRVKDLGRLLMATEIRTAQKYWQITSASSIYDAPFSDNKVVGILWSTKVDYATWFGANVEFIHCIQMLPFVPVSEELLPASWIQEEYGVLSQAFNSASQEWRGYIIMAHAIIDKAAAWNEAQSLTAYDDGNTKSNTLYWIATRP